MEGNSPAVLGATASEGARGARQSAPLRPASGVPRSSGGNLHPPLSERG